MIKQSLLPLALVAAFMAAGTAPAEAKRVKERAELFVSFDLLPTELQPAASGTADIELNRENGEEETAFDFEVNGLTDGTYTVNALTATETVAITEFAVEPVVPETTETTVEGEPVADDVTEEEVEIALPEGLDPLSIVSITVVDADGNVVLTGEADASSSYWMFNANVKVTGPTVVAEPITEPTTSTGKGKGKGKGAKGPKAKKVHGHVVVHALIVGDEEKKRKFHFVGHGAPADTELTLNVDGVPVETVTSTKSGKVMLKSIDPSVRVAGISEITVTDVAGTVVMEAHF